MIDLTDMFCGAGGSSTGAVQVPGVQVITAMNHWDLALETHNANHPDTDHVQADISQYDPRRVRRTRMLWGSPECTNHSVAIEDCLFRMLEPHEIKRGMAFPSDYVMLGNKRVQVKLAGNAVTPPAARDLVACGVESLS